MSRLVSRILLTVLIFPSATLVLFVSFFFVEETVMRRDGDAFSISSVLTALYMAVYWLALWFRSVVWTRSRVQLTLLCALGAIIAGTGVGVSLVAIISSHSEWWIGVMFGALTVPVLWIVGTIFIWRESREERAARLSRAGADAVVCPSCGYNLTGLSEARCPECGARFTLNELLASQPIRAAAEIEG